MLKESKAITQTWPNMRLGTETERLKSTGTPLSPDSLSPEKTQLLPKFG